MSRKDTDGLRLSELKALESDIQRLIKYQNEHILRQNELEELEADIQRMVRYKKKLLVEEAWSTEEGSDPDIDGPDDAERADAEEDYRARKYAAQIRRERREKMQEKNHKYQRRQRA